MKVFLLFCAVAVFILSASLSQARQEDGFAIEAAGPFGYIDWSALRISATGQGFPPQGESDMPKGRTMAERAALLDARRNLLEVFRNVRVDSETLVRDFVVLEDISMNRLAGVLERTRSEETAELPGGGVQVLLSAPLSGDILEALEARGYAPPAPGEQEGNVAWSLRAPVDVERLPDYSGVLIDARSLNISPSLRPEFHGPFGRLPGLPPELAPRYFRSIDAALASGQAGEEPLALKARGLGDEGAIVFAEQGAATLRALALREDSPLLRGAVAIVY